MRAVGVLFLHTMREIEAFGIFQMVFKKQIVQTFQPDFSFILDLSTWIFFTLIQRSRTTQPFSYWSTRRIYFKAWRA